MVINGYRENLSRPSVIIFRSFSNFFSLSQGLSGLMFNFENIINILNNSVDIFWYLCYYFFVQIYKLKFIIEQKCIDMEVVDYG